MIPLPFRGSSGTSCFEQLHVDEQPCVKHSSRFAAAIPDCALDLVACVESVAWKVWRSAGMGDSDAVDLVVDGDLELETCKHCIIIEVLKELCDLSCERVVAILCQ